MATLESLLSFPSRVPSAFTALKPSGIEDDLSQSPPPRKQARTSIGNASRLLSTGGPRKIPVKNASGSFNDKRVNGAEDNLTLRRALTTFLSPTVNAGDLARVPSYRVLYEACDRVCNIIRNGSPLYREVKMELEKSVTSIGEILKNSDRKGVAWLEELVSLWEKYDRSVDLVRSFILHLDQTYVLSSSSDEKPVRELAYNIFREKIIDYEYIAEKMDGGIADFLKSERDGKSGQQHRPLIIRLSRLLITLGMYKKRLLFSYLARTEEYYTELADQPGITDNAVEYIKLADAKVKEEMARAEEVLKLGGGVEEVREMVELTMLGSGKMNALLPKALPPLLTSRSIPLLKLVHHLSMRLVCIPSLRTHFTTELSKLVQQIISPSPPSAEADERMVPDLLDLREFADKLVKEAFGEKGGRHSREWRNCVSDAFEKGFSVRVKKPAEMIAKYIDSAMRKGQKSASDDEFQKALDDALGLYRFTKDKDVFREFYIRALAKRLLLQKSASDDFELSVLRVLKDNDKYFEKGDGMFGDLQLSRDLTKEWHDQRLIEGDEGKLRLSVMILQYSNWPSYAAAKVLVPKEMEQAMMSYEKFYKSKHIQRKLDWTHALGTATLTARFDGGNKELSVSMYQAIVLLLFEDGGTLSFAYIMEATGMEDKELRRTLQSLACGRKRVLTKIPVGKDVNDTDQFQYNAKFTDKSRRLHINTIQQSETAEEAAQIASHIEEDRTHALDAAIVRIMKARKRLRHQQLIEEVIVAVRAHFVPQPPQIKKQIDSLIEREYLERAPGDRQVYDYVA